jgi:hypothetical protein
MNNSNLRRRKRQPRSFGPFGPDHFDWARKRELLASSAVRAITRHTGFSPALALVYAELSKVGGRHEG